MKAKKYTKSKFSCFKIINKRNKYLEGVFPLSKEGKDLAEKFAKKLGKNFKMVKSKI
jgi:hypothetical protein